MRSAEASGRRDEAYTQREQTVDHDSTAEAATASLEATRVRAALADLTLKQRQAVELAFLGGYTHTEVASDARSPDRHRQDPDQGRPDPAERRAGRRRGGAGMSDIHALSGAYAVDALDDVERAQFEQHLAVCAECRAEVRSFCETAALIAETEAETPPPSLRTPCCRASPGPAAAARDSCGRARALRSAPSVTPLRGVRSRLLVAAAVALILLAVGGASIWHPWTGAASHDLADQILHAPDAVRVTEPVPGGGTLTIVRSASLEASGDGRQRRARTARPGTTYQMWLQQPGQGMVSAGLMPDAEEPTVLTGDAATAKAAAVTVEPETGSSQPDHRPDRALPVARPATGNGST